MTGMHILGEFIPTAFGLMVNLLVFGMVITVSLFLALHLTRGAVPRVRYGIAVGAFLLATLLPTLATFRHVENSRLPFVDLPASGAVPASAAPVQSTLDAVVSWSDSASLSMWVLGLWISVTSLLMAGEVAGHIIVRLRRRAWIAAPTSLREYVGWPEGIPLYVADADGPATVGLFRPIVVLPRQWIAELARGVAVGVAQHELAHARWRDPLVNTMVRLLRAVFWPSIPLWLLERIIRVERESAADASAIPPSADRRDIATYADALVAAAGRCNRLQQATGLGNGIGLEARIERLFLRRPNTARMIAGASLLATCAVALAGLPAAMPAQPPLPEFRADAPMPYRAAASALSVIVARTRYRNHDATPDVIRQVRIIRASGSADPLIDALAAPDRRTREAVAWVAGELGDPRLTPALVARLRDADPHVQHTAAWALGMIGDRRAVAGLLYALRDPNADARAGAAWALGRIGTTSAVTPLIAQLRDPDGDSEQAAAWALGRLGDKQAVGPLVELLHSTTSDDVCAQAARSLSALGTEDMRCSMN